MYLLPGTDVTSYHRLGGFKTTYPPTVLEARNLKSSFGQGHVLLEASRNESVLASS